MCKELEESTNYQNLKKHTTVAEGKDNIQKYLYFYKPAINRKQDIQKDRLMFY